MYVPDMTDERDDKVAAEKRKREEAWVKSVERDLTERYAKINIIPVSNGGPFDSLTLGLYVIRVPEIVDEKGCIWCMEQLAKYGFDSSAGIISEFSEVKEENVRIKVAEVLRNFRGKNVVETLGKMLGDESDIVRRRALVSLERRSGVSLRDVLKPLVKGMLKGKIDMACGEYALKSIAEKSERGSELGLGELLEKGWGAVVEEIVNYEHLTTEEIRELRLKEKFGKIEQMMKKMEETKNFRGLKKRLEQHKVSNLAKALA